jgi:hypothetical protein
VQLKWVRLRQSSSSGHWSRRDCKRTSLARGSGIG